MMRQTDLKIIAMVAASLCSFAPTQGKAENCDGLQTQGDMTICETRNLKQDDESLNAVYKKLVSKISPAGRDRLREAETSWVRYRDAQCEFNTAGSEGGSIHAMMLGQCLSALTRAQTEELRSQLSCEEGDMSCGNQ